MNILNKYLVLTAIFVLYFIVISTLVSMGVDTSLIYLLSFIAFVLAYAVIMFLLKSLDRQNERFNEIATLDQLTQLYNRKVFEHDVNIAVMEAMRENQSLVLIMLNIDFFKKINDSYGHRLGDEVLTEIATMMQNATREYDKVYRTGGEEFMIILKKIERKEAILLADRLRQEIEAHYKGSKNITVSLGVSQYHSKDDVTQFCKTVDDALVMAKENGRNMVCEYPDA